MGLVALVRVFPDYGKKSVTRAGICFRCRYGIPCVSKRSNVIYFPAKVTSWSPRIVPLCIRSNNRLYRKRLIAASASAASSTSVFESFSSSSSSSLSLSSPLSFSLSASLSCGCSSILSILLLLLSSSSALSPSPTTAAASPGWWYYWSIFIAWRVTADCWLCCTCNSLFCVPLLDLTFALVADIVIFYLLNTV